MPTMKRTKTKYEGVSFVVGTSSDDKPENIYYIRYRKNGKLIEEKAGRQFLNDMTPARANQIRLDRMRGKELSNEEKREAEATERAAEEATRNRWTVSRLWTEYKASNPDLKGIVTDENRFARHLEPLFGDKEPPELLPLDLDRLRVKMLKTHKPATVRNAMELLRRIINFGTRKQLCAGLTFTMQMPAVHNERTEDLSPEELERLLDAMDKDHDMQAANFMRMALFTGMRRGELFRLEWRDIDFERGFILLRDPKGGSDQKIPLNAPARELLTHHPRVGESAYVFPGRGGGKRIDIKKAVNRIKERAELPKDFRACHGLRHVYASMLASSGEVDMFTLQKLMTHKSPAMTQRYAHLRDDALRKASELAGDIVSRAMSGQTGKVIPITRQGNES